jgi:hypothetical protein
VFGSGSVQIYGFSFGARSGYACQCKTDDLKISFTTDGGVYLLRKVWYNCLESWINIHQYLTDNNEFQLNNE